MYEPSFDRKPDYLNDEAGHRSYHTHRDSVWDIVRGTDNRLGYRDLPSKELKTNARPESCQRTCKEDGSEAGRAGLVCFVRVRRVAYQAAASAGFTLKIRGPDAYLVELVTVFASRHVNDTNDTEFLENL